MAVRTVGIGHQNFGQLIQANCFYIDKTDFIRQWWENQDAVTLITRPRRFGKTLTMSMVEHFFSTEYAGRGDLFESLSIWREAPSGEEESLGKARGYRQLQGTYPVISLSFANVKERDLASRRQRQMCIRDRVRHAAAGGLCAWLLARPGGFYKESVQCFF